jgi:hypothetical protein
MHGDTLRPSFLSLPFPADKKICVGFDYLNSPDVNTRVCIDPEAAVRRSGRQIGLTPAGRSGGGGAGQYSSGKRNVVTLRSPSVMIQSVFSPKPLQGFEGSIG